MLMMIQPGWFEILLMPVGAVIVFIMFLVPAVRRLQKKFDGENKPTTWTYINELGGYVLVGICFLFWILVAIINVVFSS